MLITIVSDSKIKLLILFSTLLMLKPLSARFISSIRKTTRKPLFSLHSTLKASMSTNPGLLAIHVRGKLVDDKAIDFFHQTIANAKNSVLEKGF